MNLADCTAVRDLTQEKHTNLTLLDIIEQNGADNSNFTVCQNTEIRRSVLTFYKRF